MIHMKIQNFKRVLPILLLFVPIVLFFKPVFFGEIPIAADALVGLYHPWRDSVAETYPNGIPVKNPLITDPIRQQYPYRELGISEIKKGEMPLWNPYSFSGTPLFANPQAGILNPFNIIFFVLPFAQGWTVLLMLQFIIGACGLYLYLRNLNLDARAAVLGSLSFVFSGFFIAWFTWGTIGYVIGALPWILLAADKLIAKFQFRWVFVLIFFESLVLLAGHPQTALYVLIFSTVYVIGRILEKKKTITQIGKKLILFGVTASVVLGIVSVQLIPVFKFIMLSARDFDLTKWDRPDWFLPWAHLVQIIAPDFFGNPATGNYWGIWNYGEFVSYIGIFPLMMVFVALFLRHDRKTFFFVGSTILCLLLALPTVLAKIPYQMDIPFLSTLQPSRILAIIDFSLAVLAALGFDYFLKHIHTFKSIHKAMFLLMFLLLFTGLWCVVFFGAQISIGERLLEEFLISKRNLLLPTLLFVLFLLLFSLYGYFKNNVFNKGILIILFVFTVFDLLRFGGKFTPFVSTEVLYPNTKLVQFLRENSGNHRFIATDRRIFPPNVATLYQLQDVSGYDPLYMRSYGEMVAAWMRGRSDISPAAFNRILTPERVDTFFSDVLGIKYVLTFSELPEPRFKKVFEEGETKVYENTTVFPRAFLVTDTVVVANKQESIEKMFELQSNLRKTAVVYEPIDIVRLPLEESEKVEILSYENNEIVIHVSARYQRLLVLTDMWYSDWTVKIDEDVSSIIPVDYALRGVLIPEGTHIVRFQIKPSEIFSIR